MKTAGSHGHSIRTYSNLKINRETLVSTGRTRREHTNRANDSSGTLVCNSCYDSVNYLFGVPAVLKSFALPTPSRLHGLDGTSN